MLKFIARPWTADDIAMLNGMAGKYPTTQIAAQLGRGVPATRVKAHQLKISLRCGAGIARRPADGPAAGTGLRE
jgi:hypothetical protein